MWSAVDGHKGPIQTTGRTRQFDDTDARRLALLDEIGTVREVAYRYEVRP